MHTENLEKHKLMKHYKKLYGAKCRTMSKLQKQLVLKKQENILLQEEIYRLKEKFASHISHNRRQPRSTKLWENINSDRTRSRRVACSKELLLETFRSMQACHRAEVSVWLGSNKINFSFSPSDLSPKQIVTNFTHDIVCSEQNYAAGDRFVGEADNFNDIDYSDIYDSCGEWIKNHIRKLINVMDSFRISHEAYHELRMVSKGHLPPISRLAKEKKLCLKKFPMKSIPKLVFF